MSRKLTLGNFKSVEETSEFSADFIKNYNDESDEEHFVENLHNRFNDLPFFCERMKIEKVGKLVANLHDKEEYIMSIRNLKQALNYGLVLKKLIKFNQ